MDSPLTASHATPLPRGFVPMLAFTQALQAAAIDSMLPALGRISADLGVVDGNARQYVVTLFLLFSGIGSLLPGVLADRFGRRPVLLCYLAGYIACSAMAALAQSFATLLAARAAMGLTSAGMMVLPQTIVRDRFSGDRMARMQSTMMMVFMIVPMAAPSAGQAVLLLAGWRWIFGIMGILALAMAAWIWRALPETLDPAHRQSLAPGAVLRTMLVILTTRSTFGYVVGVAVTSGSLFAFVASAQQLLGEHFGAGAKFPLLFATIALAMSATNFVNSRIVERFGVRKVSHAAILAWIAVAAVHLWLAARGGETIWQFVPLTVLSMGLSAFTTANFSAIALQPFARNAGAAASAQAFVRSVGSAAISTVISQAYDGTARPLETGLLVCGVVTLGLILVSERGRLFGRGRPVAR
jgi:DHA1 family bicyclomycin/chloramphenicol resistance-like MFS transporter